MQKIVFVILAVMVISLTAPGFAEPININQATAEQLVQNLDGIGIKKAQAIVQYREKIGLFHTKEQLLDVKGIGASTLEKNQANILLE